MLCGPDRIKLSWPSSFLIAAKTKSLLLLLDASIVEMASGDFRVVVVVVASWFF
jgi:hypothetical protein